MPVIPVATPLGYLGVFFLIVGFFFVITGFDILKIEKLTVATGRKTWATGLVLAAIGFTFLLPDINASIRSTSNNSVTPTPLPTNTSLSSTKVAPNSTLSITSSPTDTTSLVLPTATVVPPFSNPVQDVRIRQAIAFCTDRRALAQSINPAFSSSQIDELMMDSFLPKTHWAYSQPSAQYRFDPVYGQALLDQAGWILAEGADYRINDQGDELKFELTTTPAEIRQTWAAVFEGQMKACGIHILRLHVDPGWFFGDNTGVARRDFELGAWYWVVEENPDVNAFYACDSIPSLENGWQGQNAMGWCNLTASEAAKKAADTSLSQAERKNYFAILQEEFAKDMPSLPLFLRDDKANWEHIDFNFSD